MAGRKGNAQAFLTSRKYTSNDHVLTATSPSAGVVVGGKTAGRGCAPWPGDTERAIPVVGPHTGTLDTVAVGCTTLATLLTMGEDPDEASPASWCTHGA